MKVLMINGSPNENGCTCTALSEVAKALSEFEIDSEIVWIGKRKVYGCIGCGSCAGRGACIFKDCVNEILEKMEKADGLVVGSPVYFASASGSLISALDRMFMAGTGFRLKPAAGVVSARRGGTTATLETLHKYFMMAQMPIVSSNYYPIIHGHTPEEVVQDEEGMQTMRILGRNMAWELQKIEAARKAGLVPPEPEAKIKTSYIR